MLLVIDSGNTRTKWALVDDAGKMQPAEVCMNNELGASTLSETAKKVTKVLIANVAGDLAAQQITAMIAPLTANFVTPKQQACDVLNQYTQPEKLGADRWAALIAAWQLTQQTTLVVSAGTAITIDCLLKSEHENEVFFLGGTIMPGLRLMQSALLQNTAQLNVGSGNQQFFPVNAQDAIQTGCLNAAVGAIIVMLQHMQSRNAEPVKIVLSGGDFFAILKALSPHLKNAEKQVMMAENLVLQGLAILGKETI